MSKRKSAGAWTGLILAAACLGLMAFIFQASVGDSASSIYFVDSAVSSSAR